MAFTKVVGAGIHTQSNIVSHNINSAGIITATKFDGPFDNIVIGGGGLNISGVVTSTGLDVNGNGDISGNLVVGGNLTANGDFTTLNTTLREVELLRVDADSSLAAGIVTQRGSGDIFSAYDTSTEVFKITDGGRVFIGESSVAGSAKFVVGNGGAENFEFTPGMASSYEGGVLEYIHRGDGNTRPNLNFYVNNTGQHKFWTAGSERLTIAADGKVGIGTNILPATTTLLTVGIGHSTHGYGLKTHARFQGSGTYNGSDTSAIHLGEAIANQDDPAITLIRRSGSAAYNSHMAQIKLSYLGGPFGFNFLTANASQPGSHSLSSKMVIDQNGDVGIGSVIPAAKLDIATGGNSFIRFGQDADNPKIEIFRSTGSVSATHYGLEFQQILGDFIFSTAPAANLGSHSYSERFRITPDGDVSIGSTADALRRVDVVGNSLLVRPTIDNVSSFGNGSVVNNSIIIRMPYGENPASTDHSGARFGIQFTGANNTTDVSSLNFGNDPIKSASIYGVSEDNLGYNRKVGLAFYTSGFDTAQTEKLRIDSSGHLLPGSAGTQNLGSTSKEWGNIYIADSKILYLGSDQDLSISHNGTHGFIHAATGGLYMKVANGEFLNRSGSQVIAKFLEGTGGVELYHNNIKKLHTVEKGIEVTGEVAASQDYPDIGPTVDLNFAATENLDPRIDFYRASAASYIDQNGKLVLVAPNTPRFVYDQTTKKCKGLLIETSGRNRVSSAGSNNGSATASGSVLGNAFTTNEIYHGIELPTGEIGTVRKLVSNSSGMRFGDYSGTANTSYTGSVWLRAVSGTANVYLDINDSNTINPTLTEEWVRYSVTSATNNNYRFFDLYFANTQSVYMYGVQLEDSAYVTSYIPVYPNMSFGLRAADYAVIDGQNFTDFYNPDESSVLAVGIPNRPASAQGQLNIVHIGDSNNDGHGIFREHGTKDPWYHIRNGNSTPSGGNLNPSGFGDWDAGEEARIAIAFKNGDQAISVNGGNQVTATVTSNYPTANITKMWIGSHGSGSFFEGTISRIAYYPKQLTDSQLNTLTAS